MFMVSSEDSIMKKKLLTYYGERYNDFKTQLTHDYIKHARDEDDPEYKSSYLMVCTTPEFLAKS